MVAAPYEMLVEAAASTLGKAMDRVSAAKTAAASRSRIDREKRGLVSMNHTSL
jgi:hypothetical protein